MKSKNLILIAAMLSFVIFIVAAPRSALAADEREEKTLEQSVQELLDKLNTGGAEQLLDSLDEQQKTLFGSSTVAEKLKRIIAGEMNADYGSFIGYIFALLGADFLQLMPMILGIVTIMIAFNIINSLKGTTANEGISNAVRFAAVSLVLIIVSAQFYTLIASAINLVNNVRKQIDVFFPLALTLMSATGAQASVAVYTPSVAILGAGLTNVITIFAVPALLLSLVFSIIGALSKTVSLKNMSEFFLSAAKWLLGTAFFVFAALLTVQGITASVHDGISIRAARFALSKYVPIIGGYLSEGFNLIMAGNVLIKNALGMSAIVLMLLYVVPVIAQMIVFSLGVKLAAAVCEPLGSSEITGILGGFSKCAGILVAVILGLVFLYLLFIIMIISTGNLAL